MRTFLKGLLSLGLVGLVACTAIVTSDEPVQCNTDADCTKRGPDFADSMCQTGFCVPKSPGTSSDGGGDGGSTAECTKNADCASKGDGFVCSSNLGKCAPTKSEDCSWIYGDPTVEGTVLYGLLTEQSKDDSNYFRQIQYSIAAKLAFKEFFETAGVQLGGSRKAALIGCTEHSPRRAAALLGNAGVKAVIGPAAEDRQLPVVETLLQARIPSFSPWINGSPASVKEGSSGFAWLAGFERAEVFPPLNALLKEKESQLVAGGKAKIRVVAVVNAPSDEVPTTFNGYGEYGDFADQRLVFNGKTAIENKDDTSCDQKACYLRAKTNQAEKPVVQQRAKDIAAFKPDIIIPFSDIDWGAQLLPALENEFAALDPSARPIYLHPFLQIEDSGYRSLPVQADPALRARITGIRAIRDNSFEIFTQKFKAALATDASVGTDPNPGAGRAFETSLLILLASYAAFQANTQPTPEQIVAALPKVTDSKANRVTLNDLVSGVGALNAGQNINFDGLFSFFDLDYTRHSSPATWTTWCVNSSAQYVSTQRTFKTDKFDGTAAPCP